MLKGCNRTCATCTWWSNVDPALGTGTRRPDGADQDIGACTFAPPVVIELAGMTMSRWPETHRTRGCGQWRGNAGGGPDDGEQIGGSVEPDATVIPFRKAAA